MYWVLNQDVKIPNSDGDHANLISSEHVERLVCLHDNEFNLSFVFGHSRRGCCGPQSRLGLCLACLQGSDGSGGGFRSRREERDERLQSRRSSAAVVASRWCCAGLYKIVMRGGGMTEKQVDTIRDHFGDETGWYVNVEICTAVQSYCVLLQPCSRTVYCVLCVLCAVYGVGVRCTV